MLCTSWYLSRSLTTTQVASYCLYSELFPNFMRARGLSVTVTVLAVTDILYLQVAPTVSAIYLIRIAMSLT